MLPAAVRIVGPIGLGPFLAQQALSISPTAATAEALRLSLDSAVGDSG